MNRFVLPLLLFSLCCWFFSPNGTFAANSYYISPVAFIVNSPSRETLSFPLEKAAAYKSFTLENPSRLVIDFPQGIYRGEKIKEMAQSRFITAIRSAHHLRPIAKTRIVIDLQPGKKVGHQLFYDEGKKVLQLVLTSEETEPVAAEEESVETVAEQAVAEQKSVSTAPAVAEKEEQGGDTQMTEELSAVIHSISFEGPKAGEERIRFRLNGFYPPGITTREEILPEVVCDFAGAQMAADLERQIVTGGNLVQRVSVEKTETGVQVVLELARGKDFDLQQIFFRDGNLFVLVVREFAQNGQGE